MSNYPEGSNTASAPWNEPEQPEYTYCSWCNEGFTETQCGEGALNEVPEVKWEKGHDKSDPERELEVHGYILICESCYDTHEEE